MENPMMKEQIKIKVNNWVSDIFKDIEKHIPKDIHIDELLSMEIDRGDLITYSCSAFDLIIDQLQNRHFSGKVVLAFPLNIRGRKISMKPPKDYADFENQLDTLTPPSIFVFSWDISKYMEYVEEYIVPVEYDLPIKIDKEKTLVYFREHRNGLSLVNQWEFSRCIYIEYFLGGIPYNI
jgi:hypothetical protein